MPEGNVVPLNSAALDVVAERLRQVSEKGFPLYRDDLYVKGEMSDAATAYARCAGSPRSITTLWPWAQEAFKPSADRRRDLVKAAALLLAEIERLDRLPLIKHSPVRRDEYGAFYHPDMPDFDEGDEAKCKAWIAAQGLEVKMVSLEYHSDEAISERYFESGDGAFDYWEPDCPEGEDWFCLSIHDTDDGPVCWWARRVVTP